MFRKSSGVRLHPNTLPQLRDPIAGCKSGSSIPRPSSFALRLPRSTRQKAVELAQNDGMSLNQFITLAVTEKIVRLEPLSTGQSPQNVTLYAENTVLLAWPGSGRCDAKHLALTTYARVVHPFWLSFVQDGVT